MFDWNNEIKNGPLAEALAPHVAAGDDVTVAAMINAKTLDALRWVSRMQLIQWAAATGMASKIVDAAANTDLGEMNVALRSLAIALLSVMNGGGAMDMPGINFANPANIAGINLWVTAGLLTTPHRDELLALATVKISRAEQVSGRDATLFDVAGALRNDDGSPRN